MTNAITSPRKSAGPGSGAPSFVTHLQQYHATYGLVYNEVKSTRLSLAERLRKLPLGLSLIHI